MVIWLVVRCMHKVITMNWPLQLTWARTCIEFRRVWDSNIEYEQFCTVLSIPIQFISLRSTKKDDCVRTRGIILSVNRRSEYWWQMILYVISIIPLLPIPYCLPCFIIWWSICWQTTLWLIKEKLELDCHINLLSKYKYRVY